MADEAVMTAPDTGAETLDATVQTNLSETTDTGAETTGEQVDSHDEPQQGETGRLRGAELYRAVKNKLKNGEQLTPQEIRSIRNAIHIAGKADEATGGDLSRFQSEREAYQSLRGEGEDAYTPEQMVEQIKSERQQLQGIFADLANGGQTLIEELATDYPDSFPRMSFAAMDKLAATDNEAFSTYVSKSAFGYLSGKQVPQQFDILAQFLPELPDSPALRIVIKSLQTIEKGLFDLGSMASREIGVKKYAPGAQNGTEPESDGERSAQIELRQYKWDSKGLQANQRLRDEEISRIASGRKAQLTEKERSEVLAAVKEEYDARIQGNITYKQAMKGYLEAGNERAYTDRITSEGKKLLPSIVQRHVNAVLDKRTAAAKNPPSQQPKHAQNGTPPPEKKDATGVTWISASPASLGLQVDYMRTSNAMLSRNEAYIRGRNGMHKWKPRTA